MGDSMMKFLKEKRFEILLFVGCAAVFLLTFYLYHLPLKAVIYPSALCFAILIIAFALQYAKRLRVRRILKRLEALPDSLSDEISVMHSGSSEDYLKIINKLLERERQITGEHEENLRDMTDYYTTWVHQIKIPISTMRLILENDDTEESRKLRDELFKIEQYVEMVLTYLRLGSDHTDYVFTEVNVDQVVKSALRKFASQFILSGLKLEYEGIKRTVISDEKWLRFVVEQVLSNSLKYTREGKVSIYMDGDDLCISDTGIGISQDNIPRIFQKGYTGETGRKDKASTGLGLYLCKRICTNLGHRISVSSRLGQGTTVKINLKREM